MSAEGRKGTDTRTGGEVGGVGEEGSAWASSNSLLEWLQFHCGRKGEVTITAVHTCRPPHRVASTDKSKLSGVVFQGGWCAFHFQQEMWLIHKHLFINTLNHPVMHVLFGVWVNLKSSGIQYTVVSEDYVLFIHSNIIVCTFTLCLSRCLCRS